MAVALQITLAPPLAAPDDISNRLTIPPALLVYWPRALCVSAYVPLILEYEAVEKRQSKLLKIPDATIEADRQEFERVLAEIPDVEPQDHDRR